MKRLILVRHAQAEPTLAGQKDFDRTLTRRGMQEAADMARRLRESKPKIDFVLTSPAARALATAEIFARALKIAPSHFDTDDRLYAAEAKELLAVIRECDDRNKHLLLVAHNPGIAECADKLSAERRIDSMPTCSLVRLHFSIDGWQELSWHSGTDVEFDYPSRTA